MGDKTTHIDLVNDLKELNIHGKFDQIIIAAERKLFHDFKSPLVAPKLMLYDKLIKFKELQHIAERVTTGYYDEKPDYEDIKHRK